MEDAFRPFCYLPRRTSSLTRRTRRNTIEHNSSQRSSHCLSAAAKSSVSCYGIWKRQASERWATSSGRSHNRSKSFRNERSHKAFMGAKKISKKSSKEKAAEARRQGAIPCLVIAGLVLL